MKPEWNSLETFLAENLQEFRPFAYFDKHLDCIRVKILDCSVTEVRLNRFLTVLQPNNVYRSGHCGFTIKGVAHLFNEFGIPMSGVFDLVELLDRIVKKFPDAAVKQVAEEFLPMLRQENFQVRIEDERLAA